MDIDYRSFITVLLFAVCVGVGIDYFSEKVHWVTASFGVLFAIWANGLFISLEDREPGGWDYDKNESSQSKLEFRKSFKVQVALTVIVFVLAIFSHVVIGS
ncbi:hypothetical protein NQT74_11625 [Alteromonas stellipolaris]|uniref:hypothetical protein n=1 Tax=Alteromonas stellipolaris TaxID=233316 RepID=UPI002117E618|nr:hypothetical protein [Alteromonas stellipolaris]MCQ8849234.1 hypothetical protein [Alteromonas stellipolaris]